MSGTYRHESPTLNNKRQDTNEDNDGLNLFLSAVKTAGELEERLQQLQRPHKRIKKIPETT